MRRVNNPSVAREIAHAIGEVDHSVGHGKGIDPATWNLRMHPSTWIRVTNASEYVTWVRNSMDPPGSTPVADFSGYLFMDIPVVIDATLMHGMFEIRCSRLFILPGVSE